MNFGMFSLISDMVARAATGVEINVLAEVLTEILVQGANHAYGCGLFDTAASQTDNIWWVSTLAWVEDKELRIRLANAFADECTIAHEAGMFNVTGPISRCNALALVERIIAGG